MMTGRIMIASLVAFGLAGAGQAQDRKLGQSVQNNIIAMAVDLNPSYAGIKPEGSTGIMAEAAITRYRSGRVTPLQSLGGTSAIGGNNQQQAPLPPPVPITPR
jgi:hypothetical protein